MSRFSAGGGYHGGWKNVRSRRRQAETGLTIGPDCRDLEIIGGTITAAEDGAAVVIEAGATNITLRDVRVVGANGATGED